MGKSVIITAFLLGYGVIDSFPASQESALAIARNKVNCGFEEIYKSLDKVIIKKGCVIIIFERKK